MNFFLHFKSEFDAFLEGNSLQLGMISKNSALPISLEVKENYPLYLKVTPLELEASDEVLLPYATKINWTNHVLEEAGPYVSVIEYPHEHYEITLLKHSIAKHELPIVLCQQSYHIKNNMHTATVFYDGIYQVSIQEKDLLFTHQIPKKIENVSIEKLKNKDLVQIKGSTETGVYYLFVSYSNNAYQIIKEGIASKYEQTDQSITVLNEQYDMAGHGVVEEYDLENTSIKQKETYSVYVNAKPKTIPLPELIPYAFLEAIKQKNYTLARSYLTEELSASLLDEHLGAYFQDFIDIVPAQYEEEPENKIALIYDGKRRHAKIYRVELTKNKISNFNEC